MHIWHLTCYYQHVKCLFFSKKEETILSIFPSNHAFLYFWHKHDDISTVQAMGFASWTILQSRLSIHMYIRMHYTRIQHRMYNTWVQFTIFSLKRTQLHYFNCFICNRNYLTTLRRLASPDMILLYLHIYSFNCN